MNRVLKFLIPSLQHIANMNAAHYYLKFSLSLLLGLILHSDIFLDFKLSTIQFLS